MPAVRESGAAFAGWSEAARERARAAGAPEPGEVEDGARRPNRPGPGPT